MDENDPRDKPDPDVSYYRYCRDHSGQLKPVDKARRNKRMAPRFDPSITEVVQAGDPEESPNYRELVEELTQNLNPIERRTWFLIIRDGKSVKEAAEEEGVSRQAIMDRLRRMVLKNDYCEIKRPERLPQKEDQPARMTDASGIWRFN